MSKHTYQEYTQNKENYMRYYIVDTLFYLLYIIILVLRRTDGLLKKGGSNLANENNPGVQILLVFYILNGYQVLVGYCIVFLKLN